MLNIQTDIRIKASPNAVWEHLTNFRAYPRWNPFITQIEEIESKKLSIELTSGGSKMRFKPIITQKNPQNELRWIGRLGGMPGLFTGEHYFLLSEEGQETHLIQGESFSGGLAILLWPFIRKDIHANFIRMNEALKELVEDRKS